MGTAGAGHAWVKLSNPLFSVVGTASSNDVLVATRVEQLRLAAADGQMRWSNSDGGVALEHAASFRGAGDIVTGDGDEVHWASADGTTRWVYRTPTTLDVIRAVSITPSGDVVVATVYQRTSSDTDLVVLKLDGASGALIWRTEIDGDGVPEGWDKPQDVTTDSEGDVIVLGHFDGSFANGRGLLGVIKLDGQTGNVLWRHDGTAGEGRAVRVDSTGSAYVAAIGSQSPTRMTLYGTLRVFKLAGANGEMVWNSVLSGREQAGAFNIALLPDGSPIVGGRIDNVGVLLRFDAVSGAEVWRWQSDRFALPVALAAASGVAVVGGSESIRSNHSSGFVGAFDAGTGRMLWRQTFAPAAGNAQVTSVALSMDGAVAMGGLMANPTALGGALAFVARLRGADGISTFGTSCGTVVCTACEVCASPGTCAPATRTDCTKPVGAGQSYLQIRDGVAPTQDRITWRWSSGESVIPADLGTPHVDTDYALCVYQNVDSSPSLVLQRDLSSLIDCGKRPCWSRGGSASAPTFGFKAATPSPAGKTMVAAKLRAGAKPQLSYQGKGAGLSIASLGLSGTVRVELRSSAGKCWAADYTGAAVLTNSLSEFRARSADE